MSDNNQVKMTKMDYSVDRPKACLLYTSDAADDLA
mgnify:CR=1 FL=1